MDSSAFKLDDFDRKILQLMAQDSRRTGEQLADAVGLSPAACLRRVQRLRSTGAIEREVAVLSPDLQGERTTILVLLTITRHNPKRIETLTNRFLSFDMVERVFSVTGNNDIAMIMRVPTMQDFADFADAHFFEPPVEGFESLVVLKEFARG